MICVALLNKMLFVDLGVSKRFYSIAIIWPWWLNPLLISLHPTSLSSFKPKVKSVNLLVNVSAI